MFSQSKLETLSVRPQNIIRFFEKSMKSMHSQKQSMAQEKESAEPMALMHQEFLEKYIQCQICYYIALHYAFENN